MGRDSLESYYYYYYYYYYEGDVMVFWRWVSLLVLLALEGGRLCGGCGM